MALLLCLSLQLGLAGCQGESSASHPSGGGPPPVTVEAVTLQSQLLRDVIALSGQFEAEYAVVVRTELSGVIASIDFVEGERVSKDQVLFTLKSEEQVARLSEAEAELRYAVDTFERTRELTSQAVSSAARRAEARSELDQAKARVELAKLQLDRTRILAPFDGVTDLRLVAPGDRVTPEIGLVSIAAVDRLQLIFAVQEMGVALARTGAVIHARVVAWPAERFRGEVFFVSPNVDPATRRLVLKAWVENPDHRLKPGMFANVDVEISRKENAVVVPETALVYDRNGTYVWRLTEESTAEKIPVDIGLRKDGQVEILRGVSAGDQVVSAGTHKVMAGKELRIAPLPPTEHARDAEREAVGGEEG